MLKYSVLKSIDVVIHDEFDKELEFTVDLIDDSFNHEFGTEYDVHYALSEEAPIFLDDAELENPSSKHLALIYNKVNKISSSDFNLHLVR